MTKIWDRVARVWRLDEEIRVDTQNVAASMTELAGGAENILLDSGRILLTIAVTLFLAYLLFITTALLAATIRSAVARAVTAQRATKTQRATDPSFAHIGSPGRLSNVAALGSRFAATTGLV